MNKPIANKILDSINEALELITCTCSSFKNHDNGLQVFRTYSSCPKCIILRDLLPKLENEVIFKMWEELAKPFIKIMRNEHITFTDCKGVWENCPNEQCKRYIELINEYYQPPIKKDNRND